MLFDNISSKQLFIYSVILCCLISYFRHIDISPNVVIGTIFASAIIIILQIKSDENNNDINNLQKIKLSEIYPTPKIFTKYIDISDLIFSIQDFYTYNPQAYENMIQSIDKFMEIYEYILLDKSLAGDYYSIADTYKRISVNELHSIIISIPADKKLISKLNNATKTLEIVLNKYLYVIYQSNEKHINENGYFNNTKLLSYQINPINKFENNNITSSFDYYD